MRRFLAWLFGVSDLGTLTLSRVQLQRAEEFTQRQLEGRIEAIHTEPGWLVDRERRVLGR